jgi:hypothetical protein
VSVRSDRLAELSPPQLPTVASSASFACETCEQGEDLPFAARIGFVPAHRAPLSSWNAIVANTDVAVAGSCAARGSSLLLKKYLILEGYDIVGFLFGTVSSFSFLYVYYYTNEHGLFFMTLK